MEPILIRGRCEEIEASGEYPRFQEFRARVEADAKRSGNDPEGIFLKMLGKEAVRSQPGKDKAVADAQAAAERSKRASAANRGTGQRPPAAKAKVNSQMAALGELIGEGGRTDPITGGRLFSGG